MQHLPRAASASLKELEKRRISREQMLLCRIAITTVHVIRRTRVISLPIIRTTWVKIRSILFVMPRYNKILITGGCGYVGHRLAKELWAKNVCKSVILYDICQPQEDCKDFEVRVEKWSIICTIQVLLFPCLLPHPAPLPFTLLCATKEKLKQKSCFHKMLTSVIVGDNW
jgi:hypothetical protein